MENNKNKKITPEDIQKQINNFMETLDNFAEEHEAEEVRHDEKERYD